MVRRRLLIAPLRRILLAAAAAVICAAPGGSQTTGKAPRCDAPEHRQFDFWIGRWDVSTPDGTVVGENTITKTLDGCVLHERWDGRSMQGESFNLWDRATGRWHQTWVDSQGQLLLLDGAFEGEAMRLSGDSGPSDRRISNRITWTPAPDGTVRQLWEVSSDRGATWRVVFDGRYRRKAS